MLKSLEGQRRHREQEEMNGVVVMATSVCSRGVKGATGGAKPPRQLEPGKHVKNENGGDMNHQGEQEANRMSKKNGGIEENIVALMLKLTNIHNLYRDPCCHGCGSEKVMVWCSRCRVAMYCSEACGRNRHVKHLQHCNEILTLRSAIRERHLNDFFLPQFYREKLSLLTSKYDSKRCSSCRREKTNRKLKICAGCVCAKYCSKACQVEDWSVQHKGRCNEIRRLREMVYEADEKGFVSGRSRFIADFPDIDKFVDLFIGFHGSFMEFFHEQFDKFPKG